MEYWQDLKKKTKNGHNLISYQHSSFAAWSQTEKKKPFTTSDMIENRTLAPETDDKVRMNAVIHSIKRRSGSYGLSLTTVMECSYVVLYSSYLLLSNAVKKKTCLFLWKE